MAVTRLGLGGSGRAYAGFVAKTEAAVDISNLDITGTYALALTATGTYSLAATTSGVYAPGISLTGEWETE